jgi:hypothetical protein
MTFVLVETHQSRKLKQKYWFNNWYRNLSTERKNVIRKKKLLYQRLRRASRGQTKLGTSSQDKNMTPEEYVLSQLRQLHLKRIR